MTERWKLKITFDSDWHIGSGAGIPGSVDRTVLRGADGFPYIPAKTLTGILRDSAEFVASVRDVAESGKWKTVLSSLFGDQINDNDCKAARIGIGDAVFSDELKKNILRYKGLVSSLFIVQPGIRIDRATGRSMKDHLFTREEVRGGVTLCASISALGGSLTCDEVKLLQDAVAAARRIGGHRRRGSGKCTMRIERDLSSPAAQDSGAGIAPNHDALVELEFIVETLQPVVVNRATLGNVVQSDSYIPGTYLLPYFTKKIAEGDEDAAGKVRDAVAKGDFSVGPFFPEAAGCAAYPVPFSYARRKAESHDSEERSIFNRLVQTPPPGRQMKDIRDGFVSPGRDGIFLSSSEMNMLYRTHNTIDDEKQNSTEKSGGPFTYEAIKPRLKFRGTLKISQGLWKSIPQEKWEKLFVKGARISIGQSKKDEYGLAEITCAGNAAAPGCERRLLKNQYLVAYLLSDVLVRDSETLAFKGEANDFRERLAQVLCMFSKNGSPVSLKDISSEGKNPLGGDRGHCVRMGRRESWHVGWRLPRPSFVYLKAGSVFLFEADPSQWEEFNWDAAIRRLSLGIGDRVGEGYGRILLNPSFLCDAEGKIEKVPAGQTAELQNHCAGALSDEDKPIFEDIKREYLKNIFRKASRRYIAKYVGTKDIDAKNDPYTLFEYANLSGAPSSSQFGILRELASAIWEAGSAVPISYLFETTDKRNSNRQKWNDNWRAWLEDIAGDRLDLWAVAGKNDLLEDGEQSQKIKEGLRIFALSTFLDTLCEAMFDKRSKEGNAE
jgi:CRISPR-associated protein Csx10